LSTWRTLTNKRNPPSTPSQKLSETPTRMPSESLQAGPIEPSSESKALLICRSPPDR
jgi:hypothetical protein